MDKCRCGKPAKLNRKRCYECLERERIAASEKRAYRKQNNLCIECGELAEKGYVRCITHLNREKNQTQRYKENGKCLSCGKDSAAGRTYCQSCMQKLKDKASIRRKYRKKNKLCVDCGNEKFVDGSYCEICYLKATARRHFNDVSKVEELKILFDSQNGICPYSGRKLIIGNNLSELDHCIPVSCGGLNEIENLQWIDAHANRMKWNYSEKEFLSLIKEIYEYCKLDCWQKTLHS